MWRTLSTGLLLCACFALPGLAQQAVTGKNPGGGYNLSLTASGSNPAEAAPSPKYLIEIYPPSEPAGNQAAGKSKSKGNQVPPKSKSAGEAVVGNEPQTITFEEIPSHNVWDPSFEVKVRSSSSLPVTITVKSGPATVSGSTVTIYESGTVQLEASQPGDSTYQAAKPVDRTFAVAEDDDYCVPGLIAKPEPPAKRRQGRSPAPSSPGSAIRSRFLSKPSGRVKLLSTRQFRRVG